jgi:hypothetical protein
MRIRCLVAATAALLSLGLVGGVATAGATAVPEKTDIMFIFDTSGSMGNVLTEAKEGIKKVVEETRASLGPNTAYGVADVEDVPGYFSGEEEFAPQTEEFYEDDTEKPWHLWQAVTTEVPKVEEAIEKLSGEEVAHSGGDLPEAYGRALWETDTNPQVGWRTGARHEIVLIADNVPHTANVNLGIPEQFWIENPFDTGEEPGGRFGIPDTAWAPGQSLEFHATVEKLALDGKPLAMVDYFHTGESEEENYVHYWEYWAAQTGGQAVQAVEGEHEEFSTKLDTIIKESTGKSLPACPTGYEPRVGESACVPVPIVVAPTPPPASPTPVIYVPSTAPPIKGKVYVLEDGEVEEEVEFLEEGEFEDEAYVEDGASLASFQQDGLAELGGQELATIASKCKKGFVRKNGKCVSNKPVKFGHVHIKITKAGRYRIKVKPSKRVLLALKEGKTLHVKFKLVFTPAGTTDHIHSVRYVTVHLKKKHKKK